MFGTDVPLLDERQAIELVVGLGELDMRAVLRREVTVQDVSRRCRCLLVRVPGSGWAVKQGANTETRESLAIEASMYRRLMGSPMQGSVPRYVHDDPAHGVLVVELVDGVSPREHEREQPREARARYAVRLGRVLATLHAMPTVASDARTPPRILTCHQSSLESIEFHSPASLRVLERIQTSTALTGVLDSVAADWSPIALSHNDLRADNIVVDEHTDRLTVIDWEMAGLADPRWDLCSLLAERLAWWLADPDLWLPEPGADARSAAAAGLVELHVFAGCLLAGYGDATVDAAIVRWIAARLVQTAMEHCHRDVSISPLAEQMLQIAANMFRRPEEAGRLFFGMDL